MSHPTKQDRVERVATLLREMPTNLPSNSLEPWPEYQLTMGQFKALTFLQSGPLRMSDLSISLNVSLSSMTNLVDRLESKGLVRRAHASHDRRVVMCELTEEGRETVTALWQIGRNRLLQVLENLTESELNRVIEAFELIISAGKRAQVDLQTRTGVGGRTGNLVDDPGRKDS